MKVATSILSVKDDLKKCIDELNNTDTDYIHLDIMDGEFVENKTWHMDDLLPVLEDNNKPLDVHLMVNDVMNYINEFSFLNPSYITFHYEAVDDVNEMIDYVKKLGIKVGLAIKPSTKYEEILSYLPKLDEVLVMSVNPGMGGQEFMLSTVEKLNNLKDYKINNGLDFIINVDGGINNETVKLVSSADMVVSGSYIVKNDYQTAINNLRG